MLPYYEFYSDMDLLLGQVEEMIDKCNDWWLKKELFNDGNKHEESSDKWRCLGNRLKDILYELSNEPFFYSEEPF